MFYFNTNRWTTLQLSRTAKAAFAAGAFVFATSVCAQSMKEQASLLDKPDGSKAAEAKAGEAIKILKRQGFWVEVDAGGKKGWVKLSQITMAAAGGGSVAIDTGRTGKGNIVSSSAARGLSAKDLLEGKPDTRGVAKLEGFVIDAAAVAPFRSEGGINPVNEKIALSAPAAAKPEVKADEKDAEKNKEKESDLFDDDASPKKKKKAKDDW